MVNGIHGSRYAPAWKDGDDEDDPKLLVAPQMFRSLIGRNHPEFASGRQQDAYEFLQYFLEHLARAERPALGSRLEAAEPFTNMFEFALEERLQESEGDRRVKYSRATSNVLGLPVKLDDAENLKEVMAYRAAQGDTQEAKKQKTEGEPEEPKPVIPLQACIARFAAAEDGIPFRGGMASKTTRIASMPKYLLIQLQRYYVDEKWIPNKLDCKVPMPDTLNLEDLRGKGIQPDETALPDDAGDQQRAAAPALVPDEMAVAQLVSMGLTENAASRACIAVQNAGAEVAAAWYFEHTDDPDINDPLPAPGSGGGSTATEGANADPEAGANLTSLGFSEAHVVAALKACSNNSERAADWLFSHAEDLDGAVAALQGGSNGANASSGGTQNFGDGTGDYSLVGFVSHIGRHTSHGHYVCHAKRDTDGGWVIFDDQKVAKSESPPLDLGYIYLYRRKDAGA